ncbi:hypothetical protein HHK36_024248 [Tetracentron sinense]|uniref:Expansin n=1 Tax=Tetracentron sinense TaxID=13715 RepID=A0A834YIN7_TETSI|nr:hypothetical protein HHK36_024248 [Tetracentron sinense]
MVRYGNTVVLMSSMALFFVIASSDIGWDVATATFSGDQGAGTTPCGYGDLAMPDYGIETTGLSSALFNNGLGCGACYLVMCYNSTLCQPGSVLVTATDFCAPNPSKPPEAGGWCNPPNKHFDLNKPMFLKIAVQGAGIVPVQYRRASCQTNGGIKFEISGNPGTPYVMNVLVYNVRGAGDVQQVAIKGSQSNWVQMSQSSGQNWQTGTQLQGQSLSFQVTTSDGKMLLSDSITPANWHFGQTFEGNQY